MFRQKKKILSQKEILEQGLACSVHFPCLNLSSPFIENAAVLQYLQFSAAIQCCSVLTIIFLASGIEHNINYKKKAHPKHFLTRWFFQWVNLFWGGSLISPRPTYPLQRCSTAALKCLTPTRCSAAVLQCCSAAVPQQHWSAEVLKCLTQAARSAVALYCCIAVLLQCCSAALLQCSSAALLHTCIDAVSYSFQFLPLG